MPSRSPTTGVVAVETLEEHPGRAPACRSVGSHAPVASVGSTARSRPIPVDNPGFTARSYDKSRRLAARPSIAKGVLSRAAAPSLKARPQVRRPVVERRVHPPPTRRLGIRRPGAQPGVRSIPPVKREPAPTSQRGGRPARRGPARTRARAGFSPAAGAEVGGAAAGRAGFGMPPAPGGEEPEACGHMCTNYCYCETS